MYANLRNPSSDYAFRPQLVVSKCAIIVQFTGRNLLYGPLNSKFCSNWNLPSLFEPERYNKDLINLELVFLAGPLCSYETSVFSARIYNSRAARLRDISVLKQLDRNLQSGPQKTKLVRGM